MNNSELSLNFGISYGEFYYCKSNNFLQEEKRESFILLMKEDDELVELIYTWERLAASGAPEGCRRTTSR